tara:strand:- start:17911 stop:18408 length:498 start_codon:yes stop_codon:yes gene_type:complete
MEFIDATTNNKYSLEELSKFLETQITKEHAIYIGVDSQERNNNLLLATAVILHKSNKGGALFYCREFLTKTCSLRQRLLLETQRATEVAIALSELCDKARKFTVHLDVNSNSKHKSNMLLKEAKSYVIAQGFDCEVKPNSWASFCVADKLTKGKRKTRHYAKKNN